ncbi:MAG: hypothetical protein J6A75_11810 [Lachnospiraceae bacterium]|nr:hypothetical protein [Lachnospiraceae bacterium]
MKRLLPKKWITAGLFLLMIFLYSGLNAAKEIPILIEKVQEDLDAKVSVQQLIADIDTTINENVYERYTFIDAYGLVQKCMDKKEENAFEVVKDEQGKLHYTYFTSETNDTSDFSKRVGNLRNSIEDKSCELIYLMPPDKYIEGYTTYARGIPYSMVNETADQFLAELEAEKVNYLDFREHLKDSGLEMEDVFFNTDHHWTIETVYWASNVFFQYLETNYKEEIPNEAYYEDIRNYNQITYENCFLGSQGRKAGRYYTKADDFTLIYPKFKTSYELESTIMDGMTLTGRFEEALLAMPVLRQTATPYDTDLYMAYMYGNQAYAHIKNLDNPEGLNICFIKDSFAVPFATFASLRCANVYLLDPRYYEESMEEFINKHDLDYVVVMFSPEDLSEEFFTFGAY